MKSEIYAYPRAHTSDGRREGMTLRDHFAGQVLAAWVSNGTDHDVYLDRKHYADMSYEFADAMMARREQR